MRRRAARHRTLPPTGSDESDDSESVIQYTEPPIERYEKLAGVKNVARVFVKEGITVQSDRMRVPAVQKTRASAVLRTTTRQTTR